MKGYKLSDYSPDYVLVMSKQIIKVIYFTHMKTEEIIQEHAEDCEFKFRLGNNVIYHDGKSFYCLFIPQSSTQLIHHSRISSMRVDGPYQ